MSAGAMHRVDGALGTRRSPRNYTHAVVIDGRVQSWHQTQRVADMQASALRSAGATVHRTIRAAK